MPRGRTTTSRSFRPHGIPGFANARQDGRIDSRLLNEQRNFAVSSLYQPEKFSSRYDPYSTMTSEYPNRIPNPTNNNVIQFQTKGLRIIVF